METLELVGRQTCILIKKKNTGALSLYLKYNFLTAGFTHVRKQT